MKWEAACIFIGSSTPSSEVMRKTRSRKSVKIIFSDGDSGDRQTYPRFDSRSVADARPESSANATLRFPTDSRERKRRALRPRKALDRGDHAPSAERVPDRGRKPAEARPATVQGVDDRTGFQVPLHESKAEHAPKDRRECFACYVDAERPGT